MKSQPFANLLTAILRRLVKGVNHRQVLSSFWAVLLVLIITPLAFNSNAQTTDEDSLCHLAVKKHLAIVSEDNWQLWRKHFNYEVAYQNNDGKIMTIKALISLNVSAKSFLNILHDVNSIPDWMAQAKSASIKQHSPNKNTLTIQFKKVWPVGPRELIIQSTIATCASYHFIEVTDANDDTLKNQTIRMELLKGFWLIEQVNNAKIKVHYVFSIDPKGDIPQWLAHKVALRNIWRTLENLHQQINKSKENN